VSASAPTAAADSSALAVAAAAAAVGPEERCPEAPSVVCCAGVLQQKGGRGGVAAASEASGLGAGLDLVNQRPRRVAAHYEPAGRDAPRAKKPRVTLLPPPPRALKHAAQYFETDYLQAWAYTRPLLGST